MSDKSEIVETMEGEFDEAEIVRYLESRGLHGLEQALMRMRRQQRRPFKRQLTISEMEVEPEEVLDVLTSVKPPPIKENDETQVDLESKQDITEYEVENRTLGIKCTIRTSSDGITDSDENKKPNGCLSRPLCDFWPDEEAKYLASVKKPSLTKILTNIKTKPDELDSLPTNNVEAALEHPPEDSAPLLAPPTPEIDLPITPPFSPLTPPPLNFPSNTNTDDLTSIGQEFTEENFPDTSNIPLPNPSIELPCLHSPQCLPEEDRNQYDERPLPITEHDCNHTPSLPVNSIPEDDNLLPEPHLQHPLGGHADSTTITG